MDCFSGFAVRTAPLALRFCAMEYGHKAFCKKGNAGIGARSIRAIVFGGLIGLVATGAVAAQTNPR